MPALKGQKSALFVVAALFLISGGVRAVTGLEPAMATAQQEKLEDVAQSPESPRADLDVVLEALNTREARIRERETALDDRLMALSAAEGELNERLAELQAAEASLLNALALSETANDTDIGRLTAVYENMKPADAADLFEQMAPEFSSGFLIRMRPESAAAIMAGLDPQTAYSVSVLIAGRNANAPTQ